MRFLYQLLLFLIVSIGLILDYMKTKKTHKLLGIPIMAYFFLLIPQLEKFKINIALIYIPFLLMCLRFVYVEYKTTKQHT